MRNQTPTLQANLPRYADGEQLSLPLPPVPRFKADLCRYCHSCHMSAREFVACREANI